MFVRTSKYLGKTPRLVFAIIIGNVIGITVLQIMDQTIYAISSALFLNSLTRFLAVASWGIAAATAGLVVGLFTKRGSFAVSTLTNAYLLGMLAYFLVLVITNVLPPTFFIFQIISVLLSGFFMLRIGMVNSW